MINNLTKRFYSKTNVVIVSGKRTPIGSFMGQFKDMPAPHLGTEAAKGAIAQAKLNPQEIEEVYFGAVMTAGMGQAPDRQIALGCGVKNDTPSTTINKVCASGMKSVMIGAQSIQLGTRDVVLAGGMESMSKCVHYQYLRAPNMYGHAQVQDSIQLDGLTDVYNNILMGACVEKIVAEQSITREQQDHFAIQSYERARAAQQAGVFDWEIQEVVQKTRKGETTIKTDEEPSKFFPDKYPGLKPAFSKTGTITPANASKINDGACAFLLMSEEAAKARNLQPLARIVAYEDAAVAPIDFGIAPALAVQKILARTGIKASDIDFHEVNEAFSAVVLANMQLLDIPHEKVNVHGGAVALGHPLGMSGARIILSLMNVLKTKDANLGMASICNGGGGASCMIIERMN